MKINKITPDETPYLQIIENIANPPKSLYLYGNVPDSRRPTVAIIGSRKPTSYGKEVGYRLAYELAQAGVVIVSGLALGLDSIAHQAALDAHGSTIAVLPGPIENIYPRSHRKLAATIVQSGGALLSEYERGTAIMRHMFIERNRIAAGISDGVLVVEAAAKSGTMHTAHFALEQGRSVMAVPGNITSPTSAGCNNLIKTGALAVTEVADILRDLGLEGPAQNPLPFADGPEEQAILDLIAKGVREGEILQRESGLGASTFNQTLSMLEITGKIKALGSNRWGHR